MQRITTVIIVEVATVSLIVCEIHMAAMTFQKDEVPRRQPNDFSSGLS